MVEQKIWKALTTEECYGYREAGELMEEIRKAPKDVQSASNVGLEAAIYLFEKEHEHCERKMAASESYALRMIYAVERDKCAWAIQRIKLAQGL